MSHIGIKLANHDFFPIIDENETGEVEKDLELTTVRDNQESVQINLFKQSDNSEPDYIGSLIIEDIAPQAKGDATISLKLKMDEDKNLSAEAIDLNSGAKQSLSISLKNIEQENFEDLDFDLAQSNDFADIEFEDETEADKLFEDETLSGSEKKAEKDVENINVPVGIYKSSKKDKKAFPVWLTIFLILLGIGLLVLAILLLTNVMRSPKKYENRDSVSVEQTISPDKEFQNNNKPEQAYGMDDITDEPPQPSEQPKSEQPKKEAETASNNEVAEMPKQSETVEEKKSEPKQAERKPQVKQTITETGAVRYKIKWGDTLWDLSETYYKNPWMYKKIARHNKIKNPNLIISGTYIEIPPR